MSTQGPQPSSPRNTRRGIWYLLAALFMYLGSVVLYFHLYDLERTGRAASMNWVVWLLYKLGGKWLVVGFTAFIATGVLVLAIKELTKPRE